MDADVHHYVISGLTVASDIALPGLIGTAAPVSEVTIRRAPVPAALADATAIGPTWQIAGDRFLLRVPRVARFLLENGHAIRYEPDADGAAEDVGVFLLGTVIGILLHQRRQIVLHASAVRVGDKAVLFCGPSGAGKSTLAAALVQRGYPLLTDDVCAIDTAGSTPIVHADGRQLKLWAQAIDRLALAERRGARMRQRLDKFYVEPQQTNTAPLPLGLVYILRETRPPHVTGIERPNVVDTALLLRNNAYRPQLVIRMEQQQHYFQAATIIANAAAVFMLTRPLSFAQMPATIAMLEQHWRSRALIEAAA